MSFDNRWRNFGFMCVYIVFNAAICFAFFYLTKVANFNTMALAAKFGQTTNELENPRNGGSGGKAVGSD
jgi:hypothetical protein